MSKHWKLMGDTDHTRKKGAQAVTVESKVRELNDTVFRWMDFMAGSIDEFTNDKGKNRRPLSVISGGRKFMSLPYGGNLLGENFSIPELDDRTESDFWSSVRVDLQTGKFNEIIQNRIEYNAKKMKIASLKRKK
jgi:hypothetical protein